MINLLRVDLTNETATVETRADDLTGGRRLTAEILTAQLDPGCDPLSPENLLVLARSEAGQLEITCEDVRLAEVLQKCWNSFADQAAERELRIEWRVDEDGVLKTDRELLRLILQNVLGNAVTYANRQGEVRIESAVQDGRIALSICNSGSKLSEEQAKHVFERFWRGDAARSAAGVHCGLGLALCERLMAVLGGSISAHSTAGGDFAICLYFRT